MRSVYWERYPMFGLIDYNGEIFINRAAVEYCKQNKLTLPTSDDLQYSFHGNYITHKIIPFTQRNKKRDKK